MVRKVLLICGIVSSLLYIGGGILAALRWEGYSYTDQGVSELMAIEAPTRPLLVDLFSVYDLLAIAFGIGVWASAGGKRALRVTGILLVAWATAGLVGLLFTPMHSREAVGSAANTLHIIVTSVLVLLLLVSIGFAAAARRKGFRLYSIATILILLVFGAVTGLLVPRLAAQFPAPIPWLGATGRVNIYCSMQWILVLAIALLRAERDRPHLSAATPS